MDEVVLLAPAFAAGVSLGAFFFGGLWWTVIRGVSSQQPALWFFGSMLLRTTVTLAGFYFVGREHWERWLPCLLGFALARLVVTWLTRPPAEHPKPPTAETSFAP
jgi:F1F0 ATPase subunit 2